MPAPAPSPAPALTPTGCAAAANGSSISGSSGSNSAPFGLTAALAPVGPPIADFDSNEEYHWDGDAYGTEYSPPSKVNMSVAPYSPSCSHVTLVALASSSCVSLSSSSVTPPCLLLAFIYLLDKLSLLQVDHPLP